MTYWDSPENREKRLGGYLKELKEENAKLHQQCDKWLKVWFEVEKVLRSGQCQCTCGNLEILVDNDACPLCSVLAMVDQIIDMESE